MLVLQKYNRDRVITYAQNYALKRNNFYIDYSNYGGNCTNFCSQCVYEGCLQMNFSKNGWFYLSPNKISYSWANVEPFYNFIISNKNVGPFGSLSSNILCEVGDIVQLKFKDKPLFSHSLIITKKYGSSNKEIFVCANSRDVKNVPISFYSYEKIRFLHILGYRKYVK